jgi:tetratricopeptide (TPR) repeat protein
MGNSKKALTLLEQSESLDRKTGNLFNLCASTHYLGLVHNSLGEWNKGEQYLKESLSIAKKANVALWISMGYQSLGAVYYGRGEYAKAKGFFDEMAEINEKRGIEAVQMYLFYSAASPLPFPVLNDIALGEIDKAKSLLDDVRKFAHEKQNKRLIAGEDATRAMLLCAEKKWTESIDLFERSLQEYEALGARQWNVGELANILYAYARVCLERNQPGDKEKACDLLNQALKIFQKMGAKKDIEKTMTLVETLNPPSTQTPETTVSPEGPEVTDLQANIIAAPKEIKIGESLELEIELTNTRKEGAILLTKITEVVPEGFAISKKPEFYRMEGDCLNMKEKRLGPQETEIVKLVLTPKVQGTFQVKPKILYIDIDGKEKTLEPKPASITVKELGIKGWLKGER